MLSFTLYAVVAPNILSRYYFCSVLQGLSQKFPARYISKQSTTTLAALLCYIISVNFIALNFMISDFFLGGGHAIVTSEDFTAYICGPLPKLLWADLFYVDKVFE